MVVQNGGATDQHRLEGVAGLDLLTDVDTGEEGEIQVQQNQIERTLTGKEAGPFESVGSLDHLKPFRTKEFRDQSPQEALVFDQ